MDGGAATVRLAAALGLAVALSGAAQGWAAERSLYHDRTAALGPQDPRLFTMDIAAGDVDGDGDLDLVLAIEFRPNRLLLNDGRGQFRAAPEALPRVDRDSEDAALADFDGDGDLDLMVVSEDDRVNEYYENDGEGRFRPFAHLLPVTGVSNGLAVADLDGDGDLDAVIGNNGPNVLLVNDGTGRFAVAPEAAFPAGTDVTQDVVAGDLDGDGDLDLVIANEGPDRILIQTAPGRFADETGARLPGQGAGGETRDAALADIDGDGDLDLHLANVRLFGRQDPQNRLWINDGTGHFRDETAGRLPPDRGSTMDAAFGDLDGDGDPDLVLAEFGDLTGRTYETPFRALLNDGTGRFAEATPTILPESARGNGMHVEIVDLDGDGVPEIVLASRGGPDRLLARPRP